MRAHRLIWPALVALLFCALAWAAVPKQGMPKVRPEKPGEFARGELYIPGGPMALGDVLGRLDNASAWNRFLSEQGNGVSAYIDPRSGAASGIVLSVPLIPGTGKGNSISAADFAARSGGRAGQITPEEVARAVRQFVVRNSDVLGVNPAQFGSPQAFQTADYLWQFSMPQTFKGIPVRYGRIVGTINHGNLVLLGAVNWGNVDLAENPSIAARDADASIFRHAGLPLQQNPKKWRETSLEIVPMVPEGWEPSAGRIGDGYAHRLVWVVGIDPGSEAEHWEGMVDAQTGEILSYGRTQVEAARRKIKGGVFPLTNTGICPSYDKCGDIQSATPMQFADYRGTGVTADGAGVFYYDINATTTLKGKYVKILDTCTGPALSVSESSSSGDIDLGGIGVHDCDVPYGHSVADTSAARTTYHHINRVWGIARGWQPANSWLNVRNPPAPLETITNFNQAKCNAFFAADMDPDQEFMAMGTGGMICDASCCETCMLQNECNTCGNGGCCTDCCHQCRNPGEIATIPMHEWGHAYDANDKPKDPVHNQDPQQNMSNPSEAYADIVAMYASQTSCVGYGWADNYPGNSDEGCGMTSDGTGYNVQQNNTGTPHCSTDCSGVREGDYMKHSPSTADTPQGFSCLSCSTAFQVGPCGREVHCESEPATQAAWDLAARKLPDMFGMDSATAFNLASRLFYQASANIGAWYTCNCGTGEEKGCNADNAYQAWLMADDDNGYPDDGTPHMAAIYAAFNDHHIACPTPTVANTGCTGAPSTAPAISATSGAYKANLCWSPVGSASNYWVMKTDGQAGCNSGKTRVATVSGTTFSFSDTEVAEGRPYCYSVTAVGSNSACSGPSSTCVCVTPSTTDPPPPGTVIFAQNDYQTGPGTIFSGTVVNTRASDNSYEVLKEGLSGYSKLSHIWKFVNVPAGCWTFRFEGNRTSNTEGDNFKFAWAPDVAGSPGTFYEIAGAIIDKTFDPSGPNGWTTAPFNATSPSSTIYIKVYDTNQLSGMVLDKVSVDYVAIVAP